MNYIKFCQYDAPIGSLTRREIENPYLVLEELAKKRSMEDFQKELSSLQKIIFTEDEWRNYDPGHLYATYKDIVRLIDICYLINKYSPALGSPMRIKLPLPLNAGLTNDLNSIFVMGQKQNDKASEHPEGGQRTFLEHFYESHHMGFLKIDLNSYLQIGLDASYMSNCKYEYFAIQQTSLMFQFRDLSELIAEGYIIYAKGKSIFPNLEGCPETFFATDRGHPTFLSYECISKPLDVLNCFFGYYLDIDCIYSGLKAWKKMLYEKDVWKAGGNPGNLLYLQENIAKLIDTVWLLDKKGELEKIIGMDFKVNENYKSIVKKSNKEELEQPLMVIRNFFAFKKMHEWKIQLADWLECSLGNNKYTEGHKNETNRSFKHILKFLEAAYLINAA